MASTYLTRTPGTGVTSRYKGTLSVWLKRAKTDEEDFIFNGFESSSNQIKITFKSNAKLQINSIQAGSNRLVYETNRLFTDTNAWYHIVIAIDTTLATAGDRCRLYVNGVEETSFSTETHIAQNSLSFLTEDSQPIYIGAQQGSANYFDGSMSHFHLIDGQQYAPTVFGETDATTGEWKIKTNVTATYGNHGFFILKDGNSITDQSGEGNNLTVGAGTLTKTEDNPSNVFATFNPLSGAHTMAVNSTFTNGNNRVVCGGTVYNPFPSTIGVNSGKYYAEFKLNSAAADAMIGVFAKYGASGNYLGSQTQQYSWYVTSGGNIKSNSATVTGAASVGTYTTNDIIGIALDCDNNKLYFHKNGTYITFGGYTQNPSSGQYGISITDPDSTDLGFYFMTAMDWGGSTRAIWQANFGNGYFGTTAVATNSGNGYAGAEGSSIFNYQPPTGYSALSTKGLNL